MNKVILIGNLTKAPESGKTDKGIMYSRFTIAVNRDYKDSQGNKVADFFNIVVWRGLADLAYKYLEKGRKVCVIGSLANNTYTNNEGKKVTTCDIVADELEFLSSKGSNNDKSNNI